MTSVEILPYQTGKLSAPAFQNGAAQDQQTKSAETIRCRVSAVEIHGTSFPYRSGELPLYFFPYLQIYHESPLYHEGDHHQVHSSSHFHRKVHDVLKKGNVLTMC